MPTIEEAEKFSEVLCAERSERIARLQERKDSLQQELHTVESELKKEHEELRVGNELMDVLAKNRARQQEIKSMKSAGIRAEVPYDNSAGLEPSRY